MHAMFEKGIAALLIELRNMDGRSRKIRTSWHAKQAGVFRRCVLLPAIVACRVRSNGRCCNYCCQCVIFHILSQIVLTGCAMYDILWAKVSFFLVLIFVNVPGGHALRGKVSCLPLEVRRDHNGVIGPLFCRRCVRCLTLFRV